MKRLVKSHKKLHKHQGTCDHVSAMEHDQIGLGTVVTLFVAHMVDTYGLTATITPKDGIIVHKLIMQN